MVTSTRSVTLGALAVVLRRAIAGWWNDNVPHLGAALSYYTLFSLAPILIVAMSIAGLAFGSEAVRGEIVGQIDGLVGHDGAVASSPSSLEPPAHFWSSRPRSTPSGGSSRTRAQTSFGRW